MSLSQHRVFLKDSRPLVGQLDIKGEMERGTNESFSGTLTIRAMDAIVKMKLSGVQYSSENTYTESFGPCTSVLEVIELVTDKYGDIFTVEEEDYKFGQ